MTRSWLLCFVSACSFSSPQGAIDASIGGGDADAPSDMVDGNPDLCFGTISGMTQLCLVEAPTAPLDLATPKIINTSSATECVETTAPTPDACVIAGTSITITAKLSFEGPRPVIFVATSGRILVQGVLDASSERDMPGPGANMPGCMTGGMPIGTGGASGGSLAARGGDGGPGDGVSAPSASAANPLTISSLRGGCPGGTGGGANGTGGAPGPGGGALALVATDGIEVTANITASGAGGAGAPTGGRGGGGGGSGGVIVFDTPMLQIASMVLVLANGGGGGGGSTGTGAGGAGSSQTSATAAAGGVGPPAAGDGGNGSTGAAGGPGTAPNLASGAGGGGGGGGAGKIRTTASMPAIGPQATVSPAFSD